MLKTKIQLERKHTLIGDVQHFGRITEVCESRAEQSSGGIEDQTLTGNRRGRAEHQPAVHHC